MSLAYSYPSPHPQPILPRGHPMSSGHAVAQPLPAYHPGNYILPPGTAFPPPTPQSATFHPSMMAGQHFAVSMASAGPPAASPTPSSATNRSGKSKFEAPLSPPPSSPMQGSARASSAASSRPTTATKPGPNKAKPTATRKRPNKSGSNAASRSETILSVRERKRAGGAGGPRGSIAASSSGGSSNPPTPNPSGNVALGEGWIAGAPMMTPSLTNGSTAASFSPETSFAAAMSRPMAMSRSSMGAQAPKARTLGLAFGGAAGSMDAMMASQAAKRVANPSMLPPPPSNRERSLSGASSASHPAAAVESGSGGRTQKKTTKKGNVEYIPSALVTPPPQHRQIAPVQAQQRHATPATTPTTARPPLPGHPTVARQHMMHPYPTPRYTEATMSAAIPASVMYATPTRGTGEGTGDESGSGRTSEAEAERAMMDRLESEKREIMSQLAKYGVHPTPAVFSAALVLVSERQAADPSRTPPTIDDFTAALRHVEAVQARPAPAAPTVVVSSAPAAQQPAKRGRKPGVKKAEEKGKARAMTPVIVIEPRSAIKTQKAPTPAPVPALEALSVPRIEVVAAAGPSPKIIAMPPTMPKLDEPLVLSFGPDGKATLRPASLVPAPAAPVVIPSRPVDEHQVHLAVEPTPDPAKAKRMQAFASPSMPGSSDFPTGIGAPGPLVLATNELVAAEVPGRGRIKCEKAELVRGLGEEGAALAIAAAAASPRSKGPMDEAWKARNQVWTPPSSATDGSQAAGPSAKNVASWPDTIRRFGGVVDHKSRIGRIEAWLDSPDVGDRSEHDDGQGFWTTLPSEWYETEEKEAMDRARTRAALRRYASGQEGDEVEEYVTISGGKTLRRLVRYRKRAYDADSLDAAEAEAASAKRHCSERRMTETEKVSCICTKGDDETAMVQCDGCRVWYHLACLDISEDDELPDEWHCFRCTRGPAPARANRYRPEPTLVHVSYSPRIEHFYGSSAPHHLALAPSPMPAPTASSAPNTRPVSRTAHVLASPIIHPPPHHATSQWVTPTMNPGGFVDWSRVNYSPRSPVHRRSHRFASMVGTPGMIPSGAGPSSEYVHQDDFDQAFPWAGPFTTPRTASGFPGQWDEDVVERRASMFYPPGTPVRAGHVFATPSTWRRPHHHPQDYATAAGLRSPGDVPSSPPQGYWSPVPTVQPSKSRPGHRRHGSGSVSFATPPSAAHYRGAAYGYSPNLGASGPYARSSHARSAVFGNSGPASAAVAAAAKLDREGEEPSSPSASRSGSEVEKRSSQNVTPKAQPGSNAAAQGKNQAGLGIGFGEGGEEELNQFLGL